MALSLLKSRPSESKPELPDDAQANTLLDAVIQELMDGRNRKEIVRELVRHGWNREAAGQFTQLAYQISRERLMASDQRAACARRGSERMQASYGWIVSGVAMAILLNFAPQNLKQYSMMSLIPIAYGIVEFISGYSLWYPHRQFWTAADAAKSKQEDEGKSARI